MTNKIIAICIALLLIAPAGASELIYRPVNPSFGGSAANGVFLLGLANAQKQFDNTEEKSPLEEFNERLQRSLLGRITSAVTRDIVDSDGNITPGTFETIDYIIEIIDEGDGQMTIITTDKESGDQTIIQVQNDVSSE